MTEAHPLQNKVALVTGASSGIGEAIARSLAQCGTNLALSGRRTEALASVSKALSLPPERVRTYTVDLTDPAGIEALAQTVQKDFGGVDIVIHSAGAFVQAKLEAAYQADFDSQYRVNLLAPHSLTRLLSPTLRSRAGQVVFINSSVARAARAGLSEYAATKAGLKAIADSFREELNADGVRVLSVFVGRTATPMQEAVFRQEGRDYLPERLLQPSDIASIVIASLSLPRTAEVTEIDIRPMLKP